MSRPQAKPVDQQLRRFPVGTLDIPGIIATIVCSNLPLLRSD